MIIPEIKPGQDYHEAQAKFVCRCGEIKIVHYDPRRNPPTSPNCGRRRRAMKRIGYFSIQVRHLGVKVSP